MISFKRVNRQTGFLVTVGALLVAFVAPGLVPAFASAAQVSDRSIELSSASKDATPVDYTINFTPTTNAAAFVVEFCTNTPVIGESCTAPGGFTINSATSTDTVNKLTADENNAIEVTKALTATTPVSVQLHGIHNPSAAGTFYARIVTYDTEAHAVAYASQTLGTGTVDQGSVALEITDTIGVNAAVLESLTFCASKSPISAGCTGGLTAPNLQLGKTSGTVVALDPSEVSTGSIYTQISTNAASGAIVNLKSSAAGCGGLINSSKPSGCYIAPAQNTDITQGQAKFGVKTAAADAGGTGTYQAKPSTYYNNSTYALTYDSSNTNATGVTSPYGDPFLDTAGAPASNKNMTLTFGASAAADTPAGNYSTSISLIATGKF